MKRGTRDTLTGWDFRLDPPLTRKTAIRMKCLECQGGNSAEVRRCHISDCPLWTWRMGRPLRGEFERNPCAVGDDPTPRPLAADTPLFGGGTDADGALETGRLTIAKGGAE